MCECIVYSHMGKDKGLHLAFMEERQERTLYGPYDCRGIPESQFSILTTGPQSHPPIPQSTPARLVSSQAFVRGRSRSLDLSN